MTEDPLPDSGPEREIFLRALRRFSDACEPPYLIAECPFSVDLPGGGGRGCGEECLELLDRYSVPPLTSQVPVGSEGMAAHSMGQARRSSPYLAERPFDAAESYYRDSGNSDRSRWQTISLLYELNKCYLPKPGSILDHERCDNLLATADELRRRGFDVEAILRLGLGVQFAGALALAVVMPGYLAAQRSQEGREVGALQPMAESLAEWSELLDAVLERLSVEDGNRPPPDASELAVARYRMKAAMRGEFPQRIHIWSNVAPTDDLINWRPPAIGDFLSYDLGRARKLRAEGLRQRWVMDRFTQTYLNTWNKDSLTLEWRYQHSLEEPPCPPREMRRRSVDNSALARAIADASTSPVSDASRVFLTTAARLLQEDHREAAAAMYDAARQEQWESAELHNNFGFCRLPDDPAGALQALEIANRLGYPRTVNTCNRVLALFLLGSKAAALEVAERALDRWRDLDSDPSYLWDFESPELKLNTRMCPRCYLAKLAAHIAQASGDSVAAVRWENLQHHGDTHEN